MAQQNVNFVTLLLTATVLYVHGTHFRGGTISWKSEGGTKVHFYFKLGWTYGKGPGCTPNLIGQLVTGLSREFWTCQSKNCGTNGTNNLHNVNYYCTGASKSENWEQGQNDFTYTFPNEGPFVVGYKRGWWIALSNNKGAGWWNIPTSIDLRTRSDTNRPNSSPESLSKPMYFVPFNCQVRLKLPVIDPDNDEIRCRWSKGSECESVCDALPNAYLEEETCTLVFNTTAANDYINNGIYSAAVTIEDFPRTEITLAGSAKKTPSDALSFVALQFLIKTIPRSGPCEGGPRFIPPTPKEGEVVMFEEGSTARIGLYTDNGNDTSAKANIIHTSGPVNMTQSKTVPDVKRPNVFTTTVTWRTTNKQVGDHIVCANVVNDKKKPGEQRCFTIRIAPKGCNSFPCQNNGKCTIHKGTYECICMPGFSGQNCEVNIDECSPNPCPSGNRCIDGINTYICAPTITDAPKTTTSTITTTSTTTTTVTSTTTTTPTSTTIATTAKTVRLVANQKKNNTGMCTVEYEHCDCVIRPNKNNKYSVSLSQQHRDVLGVSFGIPIGLLLSVATYFGLYRPWRTRHDKDRIL